jgi:GGDEF domain-containing protein
VLGPCLGAWIQNHVAKLARGETFSYTQHLKSGHTVQVTNQPLPDGGWVDIQEDITERRKAEQKITWLAHHDPLTNAANRVYFSRELENALRYLRPGTGYAVHWIDLDKFKEINDSLGHPVGDALLKSIVRSLRKTVRGHDLVARLGGDEFAVIQAGATTKRRSWSRCKTASFCGMRPMTCPTRNNSVNGFFSAVRNSRQTQPSKVGAPRKLQLKSQRNSAAWRTSGNTI